VHKFAGPFLLSDTVVTEPGAELSGNSVMYAPVEEASGDDWDRLIADVEALRKDVGDVDIEVKKVQFMPATQLLSNLWKSSFGLACVTLTL
jgi:hypothetical protein